MPRWFGKKERAPEVSADLIVAVRERWPALTEDEVVETKGDAAALAALLELKLGYVSDRAQQDVDRFFTELNQSTAARE